MNNDMEQLLRAASYAAVNNLSAVTPPSTAGSEATAEAVERRVAPLLRTQPADANVLAVEVSRLTEATRAATAENVAPPKTSTAGAKDEGSVGETVLRTAAMMTGAGPIVMGLMKLFGSGDPEPLPALEKFVAPASVNVEAGLSSGREIGEIRYAQGGRPEITSSPSAGPSQNATIQVNIQAMDSQSFLDRQDDIARAVKEAMLHSHSLNDVVMEL